ncbi:MAG: glycerol-3-phosphate 1-O-acyltransferase PlsY [Candidatus Aminicenantales bacterium]
MRIIFTVLAYLLGAFPTGYIIFKLSEKKDIRHFGSQSSGATNIFRLKGLGFALPVVVIDVLKGFLPPFLALKFLKDPLLAALAAFAAVLGHCYPVYIKFKGGKGVATTFGAMAAFAGLPVGLGLAVFVLTVTLTRYVSLGSLLGTFSLPLFLWFYGRETSLIVLSLSAFCIILIRHQGNIRRLWKGTERKFGQKIRVEE